jgi:hypothetical protein
LGSFFGIFLWDLSLGSFFIDLPGSFFSPKGQKERHWERGWLKSLPDHCGNRTRDLWDTR